MPEGLVIRTCFIQRRGNPHENRKTHGALSAVSLLSAALVQQQIMVESSACFLLCPLIFVLAQWALLLHPEPSIALLPALWTVDAALPDTTTPTLNPRTHSASFTLGYEAARFEACNSNT
jgi:hypothetical protein